MSWICLVINSCLGEFFFSIDCKSILVLCIVVENCFNLLKVIFMILIEFECVCLNCLINVEWVLLIKVFSFVMVLFIFIYIFCFFELRWFIFLWFFCCIFLIFWFKLENVEMIFKIWFFFFFDDYFCYNLYLLIWYMVSSKVNIIV